MTENDPKSLQTSATVIDEGALTKGQLRKLNALRKSVGNEIGERAFAEWLDSQAEENTDKNIQVIVDALWPLVQQGKPKIKRGGYLVRRGRGRLIVEPLEPINTVESVANDVGGIEQPAVGTFRATVV